MSIKLTSKIASRKIFWAKFFRCKVYNFVRCLSCRLRGKGKNTVEQLSAGEWGAEIETSDDWWGKTTNKYITLTLLVSLELNVLAT